MSPFNANAALTLDEALTSGYNHNDQLKIIRSDYLSEIEAFPAALSEFMPKISANTISRDTKNKRKNDGISTTDNITVDDNNFEKNITVTQSIFSGGGSVAKLKAAQHQFRAARGRYYAAEQDTMLKEIQAYLDCVEAKEKYKIAQMSEKSNLTQLEATQERVKLGESTDTDLASAKSGHATAKANVSTAFANYQATKANFKKIFGIEAIDLKMPDLPQGIPQSIEELTNKAMGANPIVQLVRNQTKATKSNEYASKAQLLPKVELQLQNKRDYYNPQTIRSSRINSESVTGLVSVTIPILAQGGAEYSAIRRAKYNTRKAAAEQADKIKEVKANCKASWERFRAAKESIVAASEAVTAQEVAYEGMVQEEKLGSKTIVDVLNTEDRLNKARERKIEAEKALILEAYNMKSLIGQLTAKSLKLQVEYFEPEREFKKTKIKVIGF
ncbi:MAG: TolC family protein [Rickettsiaceae bacterium]|nr:TolC family protein [Rickettsiaceae bacterium]